LNEQQLVKNDKWPKFIASAQFIQAAHSAAAGEIDSDWP